MTLPLLPTYYYLDHFKEMLSFVESTYASVLDNEHHAFIDQFRHLTADEQCLFVRMTNRRGNVFGASHLRYPEIGDVPAAIEGLKGKGFLGQLSKGHYVEWLSTLKKDLLLLIGREAGREEVKASWKKSKLIDFLVEHIPFEDALDHGQGHTFIVRSNTTALDFLLYLYFGKTAEDLKSFALRDLGITPVDRSAIDSTMTYVKRAKAIHSVSADAKTYSESLKAAFPDLQLAGFVDLSASYLYAAPH